jgi:VanZ family protein
MSNKMLKKIMPIICVLWICLIFFMSSDENSDKKTTVISKEIHSTVKTSKISVSQIDFYIRKSSHFFEYLVLCVLFLKTSGVYNIKLRTSIVYILFACLLIANLDEFYQSFTGRTSMVRDCLIDFGGSSIGLLIYLAIYKSKEKLISK